MVELGDEIKQTLVTEFSTRNQEEVVKKLQEILDLMKQYPQLSTKAGDASKQSTKVQIDGLKKTKDAASSATTSYKDLSRVLSSFGGVGSVLATALTGSLGVILAIVAALKLFTDQLKLVAQAGYEFARATYQLQIGLNAIRRTGTEITLRDVYDNLDRLQAKFGIFSRKELVEGSAALINLTRDFKLTKDQIFNLQDAIATLAVVNGRAMDDVQRTVALAISSGYTEGLQRLGVSINRVTIALEAQRLGWGRNYMSLTESQRAQATYNLILQKTKKYQDDLESYQLKAPGMIDSATASWKDLKTAIGDLIIPLGVLAGLLDIVIEGWAEFARDMKESDLNGYFLELTGSMAGFIMVLKSWKTILKSDNPVELLADIFNAAKKAFQLDLEEPTIETGWLRNAIEEAEQMESELPPIAEELADKLLDIEKDFEDRSADAWEDYLRDKEDLLIKYGQKAEDIERQLAQKLEDLNIKVPQQNADAWTDYYQDLEDVNTWYNQAVKDANHDHQQDLLKAEEDFQNKMRDLRQSFLFDLEDAVRERDAKQAMLLIRKYNFDKQQAEQDREDNQEEINNNYKQELADLKVQKARKLAELKDELNQKLAQIQLEYQRELEELAIWKQREYEERELWYRRESEQIWDNYQDQMSDLRTQRTREIEDLADYLKDKYNYNKKWMDALYEYTKYIIGDTGLLTNLWKSYYALTQAVPTMPNLTPAQTYHWGGSYANGGEITASKPTLAMFGERGTETATFTKGGKSGGERGQLSIKILLEDGLRAEIVNDALGEFADVMVSVEKTR